MAGPVSYNELFITLPKKANDLHYWLKHLAFGAAALHYQINLQ